jgi:dihydrofolate reductase
MRKLKIIEHISMDGVIQTSASPGDDYPYGDWSAPYRSPAGLAMLLEIYGGKFDLLLGRRTYDLFSSYWPFAQGPMAERLNAATKYVVTHRPESLKWGSFEAVGPNLIDGVRSIKAKEGADLVVPGSASVTSALLEHNLADELILLVNPVLIGRGKRLFAEGTPPRSFVFEGTKATPTGILINTYKAAGALQNLG